MAEKKTTKKKIETEPVPATLTEAELWKKLNELMVVIPEGASLRDTYTNYLKNKLQQNEQILAPYFI